MVLMLRQVWALTVKNLLIAFVRHWASTPFRAFFLPVIFIGFLSYARFLFLPASTYGISDVHLIRSLSTAVSAAGGGRDKIVFVNNGFTGGAIERVITEVTSPLVQHTKVLRLTQEEELLTECRNTILGTSSCIGAAVFYASPNEGNGGIWNYSIRADGALGSKIETDSDNNDAQLYILPLQHAIDNAILRQGASAAAISGDVENYPYTSLTAEERQRQIRQRYMGGIVDILAVAFYIGMVGVSYQLTGIIARERETGMAQLLDSMMPNKSRWQPQAVRILANHLAFDLIYLPGWIVMSIILFVGVFAETSPVVMLFFNILAGLATSSFSIFAAGFFRKAQLSGILTVIAFMLLAVLAQVVNKSGTASQAILSLLFPPMNYVFFIVLMARYERQGLATNMIKRAPQHTSALPGIVLWIFLIIQILVYPILGAFVERILYGTASKSRKTQTSDCDAAISITGFTKLYRPRWITRLSSLLFRRPLKTVLAIDNLNLVARKGEIMVYLGANGSGKSTTLDAIAGLTEITSGEVTINFPDQHTSLGLCPQRNVLWDDLTVLEHVQIFNRIKCEDKLASEAASVDLLRSCDIAFKEKALSKTLSGGQKRKLQLAMMFTGGSTICCVDEVSSGLDPLSRRKIWDILLAERGRRSILLTTHFLDEADLLADHIAILSKGKLKAYGTSVELKHNLGDGYRVHVYHRESEKATAIPDIPHVRHGDQILYLLPTSAEAAEFVQQLEKDGMTEYQVSGPTIEDVFLKLAEETRTSTEPENGRDGSEEDVIRTLSPKDGKATVISSQALKESRTNAVPELLTGKRISMFQQAVVLFRKRLLVVRRNPLPLLAVLLIPVIGAGLVTLFLKGYELPSCNPVESVYISDVNSLSSQGQYQLVAGPSARLTPEALQRFAATLPGSSQGGSSNTSQLLAALTTVDTLDEFSNIINTRYANITPGGFFLGDANEPSTVAWKGNGNQISQALVVLNMLDNIQSNSSIATRFQAFDVPWPTDAGKALQMITYFGLCLSIAPAFFALYPTLERLRNVRSLHYSNGVRALPLWLAYVSFDFVIVLIFSAISVIIFQAVTSVWYNIGYLFVVLFLYGLASTLLSYVISLFSRSQLAAWSFAAAGQAVMFLLYFIAYMSILTYVPAASQTKAVNTAHFCIAAVAPIANVQRALFVALNIFAITCRDRQLASYPGEITAYGGPILYLTLQSIFLFCILLWWDSGSLYRRLRRKKHQQEVESKDTVEAEVSNELTRVASSRDGLRVLHLTKQFKHNLAVDDITFGVPRGEVFALLGPNGAGKSTCISLIRGDLQPSRRGGDIFVNEISMIAQRARARALLGTCPQFDAMDTMSVYEHLDFYARIRGVSNPAHNAHAVMEAVGLTQYADRMAAKLSGGNKRKLSLGIALMGNPAVLLLDEPSSGMDAASKRVMWRTLASVIPGRSLVLTTHSMEEADALANRAGIMSSKMLALGTTDYLRQKHGDSYYVHLVHTNAPHTSDEDMDRIRNWILKKLPNARVEEKTYHGQLRFEVPTSKVPEHIQELSDKGKATTVTETHAATSISELFFALELAKGELGIEYYSVSRATLDQVFLNIVGKHNVSEEGEEKIVQRERTKRKMFGKRS
ncbi:hypothetical protein H2198_000568 [Neophaeococcomyces mojaviensis]|uniref:Uncharacterized protein n=1 Tax=Neophaeococcomyces mojaviensis TaxID=3383035 RepID=A0ACC3AJ66_9EURO|nr:hypothetical protein H2198_000568 [Knufia sp. JES_112]